MVASDHDPERGQYRIIVRPNRSLSWRGVQRFYLGIVLVSFSIAGAFASLGFWPILPFAGIEMLVLGIALYMTSFKSAICEVVTIQGPSVTIERGRRAPEQRDQYPRAWLQVVYTKPPTKGHAGRLSLRSHGRSTEIGACLTEDERSRLADELLLALRAAAP